MTSTPKMPRADQDAGLSPQERAAVRQRAAELKTRSRRAHAADKAAADEADVLAKIAQMPAGDRALAEHVHQVITRAAPDLAPRLYYGQPGYARGGKVVCFFRSGQVDKLRYSTFGFSPEAGLDQAAGLWPTSYALTQEATDEAWDQLAELVAKAAPTSPLTPGPSSSRGDEQS
ncbi:DUF1801 domain-containing protein [Kineococcus aurantiacus]|uniref:Uncharacterized protein YdhG (YjbR/CyaY superfamily) n=1 Tax=Kineococcus aurantiacus TaxID=37633 RepID=A0A7Y9DN60_9ACTN|nr:DUF1801 domain-containing protein [Kineococcus aurantiacus]NYD23689.1 uncharacterized protein YdhG (YjbR/CyaY superfamily) [Kineococcus aurantiacus]